MIRRLHNKILSLISRAIVQSRLSDGTYQAAWAGDRVSADLEYRQPQGLHFALPADADGMILSPGGNKSASVLLCASGDEPSDAVTAGEGGLHYLGTFKVFLGADGTVSLGAKVPGDFVALASLVNARLTAIATAFNAHVHSASGAGMPTVAMPPPASVASTQVRAQ